MLKRRTFLQAAAAASLIGTPSITRAAFHSILRFIPAIDLVFLDPVATSAQVSRTHGFVVVDTLYGMSSNLEVSPQMVEGPHSPTQRRYHPPSRGSSRCSRPRG